MIHVDLGKLEAILPPEEQVPGEDYAHGTRIRVYVSSVRRATGARRSRVAAPIRRWFASFRARGSGDRERRRRDHALAREAGHRTKIAVRAHPARRQRQGRLHRRWAAGAGRDGRTQQREDRHRRLLGRPGDLRGQRPVAGQGHGRLRHRRIAARAVRALVPDYQLSLAIGKEGQNARLAAKLTGGGSTSGPTPSPRTLSPSPRSSPGAAPAPGATTGTDAAPVSPAPTGAAPVSSAPAEPASASAAPTGAAPVSPAPAGAGPAGAGAAGHLVRCPASRTLPGDCHRVIRPSRGARSGRAGARPDRRARGSSSV